ncbi:MAG TPA: tripartite tricarboxylate transporter substrate-binding protein [Bradyrhizobium sp.]|nr:tripartite tricarboxylate transporter substrate-binding protein [Bradyrhizobium sp.]
MLLACWRSGQLPQQQCAFSFLRKSGLPGFEALQYYGLSAPAGTPRPIVERLNKELRSMIEPLAARGRPIQARTDS